MDLSSLSEDKFNAATWINNNYRKYTEENEEASDKSASNSAEESAMTFIQNYVAKLQLYVQQVNYAVEESTNQLVGSIPRIAKESRLLQNDVVKLQSKMSKMRKEVSIVEAETGNCMSTLERLNTLQKKLQFAKESLQESDGWGNLITELEDCFERNDLKGVCEKLAMLQKSLHAQEQLAGHSERETQVEDFKNRLEALASPSIVQCFDEGNVEQAIRYVGIFKSIQRLSQLEQYYRAVQKNALQQQWKQTLELQMSENLSQQQQHQQHFLTLFYDQLLEHCQRQTKWCLQVFVESGDAASGQLQPFVVLIELLPGLQPSRDVHILALLKTSNDRLDLLQQYAQANHNFVTHLNAFLAQSGIVLSSELCQQLGVAIYEYFHKFIQQYPRLEETQLSTQIDRLLVTQSSASDAVRHLDDSTRKVFEWLQAALERCEKITSDLALCKLINLLGAIFKRVLENFSKTQRQLSLNSGGECWSMLQYTMSLLQCLADFQNKLQKFEKTLHCRINSLADKLRNDNNASGNNVISIYHTCERIEQQRLLASISDLLSGSQEDVGIFAQIYDSLRAHFVDTHEIALSILLQPIEAHLSSIHPPPNMLDNAATQSDMPAFSFAPQECITQIGQYLLTLPQHLEPLLLSPSALLRQALEMSNIKYTQAIPCADILLSLVVEQCCIFYQNQILQIKAISSAAANQLSVDIAYLGSVVEELGLSLNLHLNQICTLLKASPENYLTMSAGCEPRLVTAIRQMRNIISTQ